MPISCMFAFPTKITPQLRNLETEAASLFTERTSCIHVVPPVTMDGMVIELVIFYTKQKAKNRKPYKENVGDHYHLMDADNSLYHL